MRIEPEDTTRRRMTCVRNLYVMEDESGRTWLAAEEATDPHHPTGGAMSHLVPGDTTQVEGDDPDQVTVVVPSRPGQLPNRLRAYRVSAALLPGADPAAT